MLLSFCLLLLASANGQESGSARLELVGGADGAYSVRFTLGAVRSVQADDGFVAVEAEGMVSGAPREGLPSLPSLSRLLVLPRGSSVRVNDLRETYRTLVVEGEGWRVAPFAGAAVKDLPRPTAFPDKEVYEAGATYRAGAPVEVEDLGAMGDRQLFRLTVHPAVYDPRGGSLWLTPTVSATLTVQLGDEPHPPVAAPVRYLLVSRPEFREGLQPFVRWKRQQGFEVVELYAATHDRDSIRALIHPLFAEASPLAPAPRYLLLVGDAGQIQSFIGTTRPAGLDMHATDLYYAEHSGDYLPDALMGRWPVNDTAQLGAVVRKTLRYEQGLGLDTAQLRRVLLVAGAEDQEPAPVTTNGQVNYLQRELALARPDLAVSPYHNPASASRRGDILADIASGAALLSYTAHCSVGGWTSPAVSFTSVDTLRATQPMLWVNNCCSSNNFSGTCFGEQLLRKPQGGAIGVIGAVNSTLWNEDYYWAVGPKYPFALEPVFDSARPGAFDRWLGRSGGVVSQGQLLLAGNLAVTAFGSPYDKFYWEIYCLLGDPSLCPWVGVPQEAHLLVEEGLADGSTRLLLAATPGATVTALQHDSLAGLGVADAEGRLAMELSRSLDRSPLLLTLTAPGLLPRIDTLQVPAAAGRAVALRQVVATDSLVTLRVENVGNQPLDGLTLKLMQSEADTVAGALLAVGQASLGPLPVGADSTLRLPVQVVSAGRLPLWQARLLALAPLGDTLCRLPLRCALPTRYPSASCLLLDADSLPTTSLEAGRDYRLLPSVEGPFDSLALSLVALPSAQVLADTLFRSAPSALRFRTPDSLTHLRLGTDLRLGLHGEACDRYLVAGHRMDSFEEGLGSYPWRQGGTLPWRLDSTVVHSGRYSLRSGPIDYRQTSDLLLDIDLPQRDTLSFWVRTSTEVRYDKFQFSVDGSLRGNEEWGESGWVKHTYTIAPGRHTLCWRYVKDESGTAGSDCVWLDDVRLPLALWDSAYGWFGNPAALEVPLVEVPARVAIYPNPTDGTLHIEAGFEVEWLRLFDTYGRAVLTLHPGASHLPLDLRPLPDGLYFLHLVGGHHAINHKIILRH